MVRLETQSALRAVRDLPFCYVCGKAFEDGDETDHDHVPASSVFAPKHRQPLKLLAHRSCNHSHHLNDEKIGQMIALRRREAPRPENRKLHLRWTNAGAAIINLDVDAAVWRWITGFHAALYREPLRFQPTGNADPPLVRSVVLPFPKGSRVTRRIQPVRPQHLKFVEIIKYNRLKDNLDRIECNRGQLVYECVWDRFGKQARWGCIFALNVCDWKNLGAIPLDVERGCAGIYMMEGGGIPSNAAQAQKPSLLLPNYDRLDPFAR